MSEVETKLVPYLPSDSGQNCKKERQTYLSAVKYHQIQQKLSDLHLSQYLHYFPKIFTLCLCLCSLIG